jgi:adenylate kinase
MNIAIVGPKAAGKGTQISKLRESFNLLYFSPSQMFRDGLKKRTQLGLAAESYMSRGELVPDDYVNSMLEEWLWKSSPQQGIVFDGYPRTTYQAEFLERSFQDMGRTFDALISLEASEDVISKRLEGRRACFVCKEEFHIVSAPFATCPYKKCEGQYLKALPEDEPSVVFNLVHSFKRGMQPLFDFYRNRQKLIVINSEGDPDQVQKAILAAVVGFR